MGTNLKPARLTYLRELGVVHDRRSGPFVDPGAVHKLTAILRSRGEQWAAEIVGHQFTRRSRIDPTYPWLTGSEMHTLILADTAEDDDAFERLVARFDDEADAEGSES